MRKAMITVGLLCGVGMTAMAQTNLAPVRSLSLTDCVQIALEHNLSLQIQRREPEIARYNLEIAYAGYEPVFDASASHGRTTQPPSLDQQNRAIPGTTSERDSVSTSIRGVLPTGLSYSLGLNTTDAYGRNFAGDFRNVSSGASIQLRQPLLRNFWIDSTRLNIAITRRQLKSTEEGLRLQMMNTINAVEQAYYDLILAYESVKVQQNAMELAERLLSENKKRVEVGALAPLDEKQAESQVAARRADVLFARRALATQQNLLKNLLSDNYTGWQDAVIQPSESLAAVPVTFNLQDSWQKGLTLRPDLNQAKLDLERQGFVLRFRRNQLFPQLDLVGSYGHNASTPDYGRSFEDLRTGEGPFWSYGATLSIPLGNRANRRNYRIGKAEQEQILLRLKQLEQDIMVQIDDAVQQAQSNFDRVGATKAAREYAEAALAAEEKKLENGKSTSFIVLELQSQLTSARRSEVQALADYNKALATLALREGSGLVRRNVDLLVE